MATTFVSILLIILNACSSSNENEQQNALQGNSLNVLTINLLFSELAERDSRIAAVADYIYEQTQNSNPVDIILLQEVVGGVLPGTTNSGLDLQDLLVGRGVNYEIYHRLSNGLPIFLTEGNAILSRYPITYVDAIKLPAVSEELYEAFQITLRQEIIMTRISVPDFGEISVYNTHLCAFCDPSGRLEQVQAVLKFVNERESTWGGEGPVILGGDFNIDLNIPEDLPAYELITEDYNHVDSYAEIYSCSDCCSPLYGYSGCTYAVPGNVYASSLFSGQPVETSRIDYIFTDKLAISESHVVFNSFPWVSDHSGVLTRFSLNGS